MDEKKQRFVRAYLKTLDPAGAARRSGFAHLAESGNARRLLRNTETAEAVERGLAARRRRKLVSADRVLEELARIAFADIRDFATWTEEGVTLHAPDAIPDDAAAAIAEISQRGGAPRIRLHDKKAALLALARHLGLFEARGEAPDPKLEHEAAAQLRDMLLARVAALATPADKPANGEDA
jgi:phage terminase small subunit